MKRQDLSALLHPLMSLVVIAVSFWSDAKLPIPKGVAKPLGELIFLFGMAMFAWVLVYLRNAFLGNVEPVLDKLVTNGPYRYVRHPLYLSMVISLVGLAVALRSLWGTLSVFLLFLPAGAYRASLEEKALARKFDQEWNCYAARTFFMFPLLW